MGNNKKEEQEKEVLKDEKELLDASNINDYT